MALGKIRLSGVVEESSVDGPGLRMCVFTQGCPHRCPGCHNPQTHPFEGGFEADMDELLAAFGENPLLSGMTFSGGEPFCQAGKLARLGGAVKAMGKNLWVYTGYTHEELLELAKTDEGVKALLGVTDVLVDGRYIKALASLDLPYRGSSNQRVIRLRG